MRFPTLTYPEAHTERPAADLGEMSGRESRSRSRWKPQFGSTRRVLGFSWDRPERGSDRFSGPASDSIGQEPTATSFLILPGRVSPPRTQQHLER